MAVPRTPSKEAEIVTEPAEMAVTLPRVSTFATDGSELDQEKLGLVRSAPFAKSARAPKRTLVPAYSDSSPICATSMVAIAGHVTLTGTVKFGGAVVASAGSTTVAMSIPSPPWVAVTTPPS